MNRNESKSTQEHIMLCVEKKIWGQIYTALAQIDYDWKDDDKTKIDKKMTDKFNKMAAEAADFGVTRMRKFFGELGAADRVKAARKLLEDVD